MKVVYIADLEIEGGATKSLIELVKNMKDYYDIEPVVLTSYDCKLNRLFDMYGIENYAVGHGAYMHRAPEKKWKIPLKWVLYYIHYRLFFNSSIKKALKYVDWSTVDLIHSNVARDDLGMEISKRTGIKNICHIREFAELDFKCWSYRDNYISYLSKNVHGFIAISEAVKLYWVSKGLSAERIRVIYNGVDNSNIKKVNRTTWKQDQIIKLVIVGGVIYSKGQWQACKAVGMLPKEVRQHVTLDIIGAVSNTTKKELCKPFIEAGILDNIHFCGQCNDIYERLSGYHIGLMCSKAEGFGRVTAEYMHAGLAVIASDRGANRELIESGVNGLIYNWNDVSSLTEAIKYLYFDRDSMISMSIKGEQISTVRFTARKNAEQISELYKETIYPKNNYKI